MLKNSKGLKRGRKARSTHKKEVWEAAETLYKLGKGITYIYQQTGIPETTLRDRLVVEKWERCDSLMEDVAKTFSRLSAELPPSKTAQQMLVEIFSEKVGIVTTMHSFLKAAVNLNYKNLMEVSVIEDVSTRVDLLSKMQAGMPYLAKMAGINEMYDKKNIEDRLENPDDIKTQHRGIIVNVKVNGEDNGEIV